MAVLTFRDAIRDKSPRWLRGRVAGAILYAIALHLDVLVDWAVNAVRARFPGVYSSETLATTGRERRIRRGRNDTDATYATRLRRWLDDHGVRGGPYAMLAQIYAHYAPSSFDVDLVYYSGRRFAMDSTGEVVRSDLDWEPDSNAAMWARWWLFYDWPTTVSSDGDWGDAGTWGDGFVWGSDLTVEEVRDIRLIPKEWNAAHAFGTVVLLSASAETWGFPAGTWGDAGTWGANGPVYLGVG